MIVGGTEETRHLLQHAGVAASEDHARIRRTATSPAMEGPAMADQDTCSRRSSGTSPASTSGRMRRSPLSVASIPLAMERTCMPGWSSEESCPPAQRTPNELTPLIMTSAPSNASSASSSWKALAPGDLEVEARMHACFLDAVDDLTVEVRADQAHLVAVIRERKGEGRGHYA